VLSLSKTNDNGYIFFGETTGTGGDVTGQFRGAADVWVVKIDSAGKIEWQKIFGGSADDIASAVIQTKDGGYLLGGFTTSSDFDFIGNHGGTNTNDGYLIKLDKQGNKQWIKMYGGAGHDYVNNIIPKNDGYVLIGTSTSKDGDLSGNGSHDYSQDYWITAIDSIGNIKWSKCYGGSQQDEGYAIAVDKNGDLIANGFAYSKDGDITISHDFESEWLIRLDPITGQLKDNCSFGGNAGLRGAAILKDKMGRLILGGYSDGNDNFVTDNKGNADFYIMSINWDYVTAINSIPKEVIAFSNAPNPFAENTTITYQLPTGTKQALLQVYTLQGVLVKVLPLNTQSTQTSLTATDMPVGVYVCSVIADGLELGVKQRLVVIK
jgi:hypothetical protein